MLWTKRRLQKGGKSAIPVLSAALFISLGGFLEVPDSLGEIRNEQIFIVKGVFVVACPTLPGLPTSRPARPAIVAARKRRVELFKTDVS